MVIDPRMLKPVRNTLVVSDHTECHSCGYDLFGLQRDGVCPECGGPLANIAGKLYRAPAPTMKRWYWGWFDPRPTASLMELDTRDMRRMVWATALVAIGILLIAGGALGVSICRIMPSVSAAFKSGTNVDVDTAALMMVVSAVGGVLWMMGLIGILLPRIGRITPRYRRKVLGDLGATSLGGSKSAYDSSLRWVGEWWPLPVRLGVLGVQIMFPLAAMASAATLQGPGYFLGVVPPSVQPALCIGLWVSASLALAPACVLLMDFASSAKHGGARRRLQFASFGVFVGLVFSFGIPQVMQNIGGVFVIILFPMTLIGWFLLPCVVFQLVVACWGLFGASLWAPWNKRDMEQREAAKTKRDIDKGKKDEEHAWRMGY